MQIYDNYFATNSPCGVPNTSYSYNIIPTGVDNCGGTGAQSFPLATIVAAFLNYHPFAGNCGASPEPLGDYRLLDASPLIKRGNPGAYPAIDRTGASRSKGNAPDVGAYETVETIACRGDGRRRFAGTTEGISRKTDTVSPNAVRRAI
jgi:hypothetical protein